MPVAEPTPPPLPVPVLPPTEDTDDCPPDEDHTHPPKPPLLPPTEKPAEKPVCDCEDDVPKPSGFQPEGGGSGKGSSGSGKGSSGFQPEGGTSKSGKASKGAKQPDSEFQPEGGTSKGGKASKGAKQPDSEFQPESGTSKGGTTSKGSTPKESTPPDSGFGQEGDSPDSLCEDAFVYCPERSTCFDEPIFNCKAHYDSEGNDPWGWGINYCSKDGNLDSCEVWVGATGCDLSVGKKVGTAEISPNTFSIFIDSSIYSSNKYSFEYNLYAGECIGSDGGAIVQSGKCDADAVGEHASDPDSYPFTSGSSPVNEYTFTSSNRPRDSWGSGYNAFPIGAQDRKYLSGHVKICGNGAAR
jgi:hypothetical protein